MFSSDSHIYGIENMELNGNELLEFKNLEGNSVKRLLRIPIRCNQKNKFSKVSSM